MTDFKEFVCDLISIYCNYYPDSRDFTIHHKNGNHNWNNVRNIILFPNYKDHKNCNSYIHGKMRYNKDAEFNMNNKFYADLVTGCNGIDVYKSLIVGDVVDSKGNNIRDSLK